MDELYKAALQGEHYTRIRGEAWIRVSTANVKHFGKSSMGRNIANVMSYYTRRRKNPDDPEQCVWIKM